MHTKNINSTHRKLDRGFTLIELSISFLIIGILMAGFFKAWDHYIKQQKINITEEHVQIVDKAISNFRILNGRYPCTASMLASPNNPATAPLYGREDCTIADFGHDWRNTPPGSCPNNAGTGTTGSCVRQGTQTITYISPFTGLSVTQQARVRVGAVPFRELNIKEEYTYDGYGSRIVYAATEHMMFADSFQSGTGGIEIINSTATSLPIILSGSASVLATPSSANYVTLSPGKNRYGGFNRDGIVAQSCPLITQLEHFNCSLTTTMAVFAALEQSESSAGIQEFDDKMTYSIDEPTIWKKSDENPDDTVTRDPIDNIGINLDRGAVLPQLLTVQGAMRVQDNLLTAVAEGRIQIGGGICEEGTAIPQSKCFSPDFIAGVPNIVSGKSGGKKGGGGGMKGAFTPTPKGGMSGGTINNPNGYNIGGGAWCPNGWYMTAIKDGAPICKQNIIQECDPGFYMIGTDANGNIICDTPPPSGCPTTPKSICAAPQNLPAGLHGDQTTIYGGYNASQLYTCNDGTWFATGSQQGQCICTPANDPPYWESCADPDLYPCGYRFDGQQELQTQLTCPVGGPAQIDIVVLTDNCVCANTLRNGTENCPSGYTQGIVRTTNTHDCSLVPPACTGNVVTSENCLCVPDTDTRWTDCPQYYAGQYQEQNDLTCTGAPQAPGTTATGVWSGWYEVTGQTQADNCTCNQGAPLSPIQYSCQTGWELATPTIGPYDGTYTIGNITFPRSVDCTSGTGMPTVVTDFANPTDTCAQPPPPICYWNSTGGPQPGTPTVNEGELCNCNGFPQALCNNGGSIYLCNCE